MELKKIPVDKIRASIGKHRTSLGEEEEMQELANNIEQMGLINPITVRPTHNGGYEVIAGERRWEAHKLAKMKEIYAIVKEMSDDDAKLMALSENIHRKDLSSIERENAVGAAWDTGRFKTQTEIAKHLGVSQQWISGILDARKIRPKIQAACRDTISTRDISDTVGLDDVDRIAVLKKRSQSSGGDGWGSRELRDSVRVVKEAKESPVVKRAILEDDLKPDVAREILKLPKEEHKQIINNAKRGRLTPEDIRWRVNAVGRSESIPAPSYEEIEELQEAFDDMDDWEEKYRSHPETKERERLVQNKQALMGISHSIMPFKITIGDKYDVICPKCGKPAKDVLVFTCCGMDIDTAYELAVKEWSDRIKQKHPLKDEL